MEKAAGCARVRYYLLMAKVGLALATFDGEKHFISQQPLLTLFCRGEFAIFAHFGVCARRGGKLERGLQLMPKKESERA